MWVLAIDFGTTATCAATCDGEPESARLLSHGTLGTRMPSAVATVEGELIAGAAARATGSVDPQASAPTPKRAITRGARTIRLGSDDVDVATAVAAVLRLAAAPAMVTHTEPPTSVVLTHPVAWNDDQLAVLSAASALAELGPAILLPEPVAAAWAIGDLRKVGTSVAVFDLGGGTLDTAVLNGDPDGFSVVGTPRGVDPLGGDDFDDALRRLVESRMATIDRQRLTAPTSVRDRRDARTLADEVTRRKEMLSTEPTAQVPIAGSDDTITIARPEYEAVIASIVERATTELAEVIHQAGIETGRLDAVLLVGDSCRTPLVGRTVWERLMVEPRLVADGKGAVALGAARYGAALHKRTGHAAALIPRPRPGRRRVLAAAGGAALALALAGVAWRSTDDRRSDTAAATPPPTGIPLAGAVPPGDAAPSETRPPDTPPSETPPSETPPSETPPSETPPSGSPTALDPSSTRLSTAGALSPPSLPTTTSGLPATGPPPPTRVTGPPTTVRIQTRAGRFDDVTDLAELAVGGCLDEVSGVFSPAACASADWLVTEKKDYELLDCFMTADLVVIDIPDTATSTLVSLCLERASPDARTLVEAADPRELRCEPAELAPGESERWYCVGAAPSYIIRLLTPGARARGDYLASQNITSTPRPWMDEGRPCGAQYAFTGRLKSGAEHPATMSFYGDTRIAVVEFDLNADGAPDGAPLLFDRDLCAAASVAG